jgi:hypothetical protein
MLSLLFLTSVFGVATAQSERVSAFLTRLQEITSHPIEQGGAFEALVNDFFSTGAALQFHAPRNYFQTTNDQDDGTYITDEHVGISSINTFYEAYSGARAGRDHDYIPFTLFDSKNTSETHWEVTDWNVIAVDGQVVFSQHNETAHTYKTGLFFQGQVIYHFHMSEDPTPMIDRLDIWLDTGTLLASTLCQEKKDQPYLSCPRVITYNLSWVDWPFYVILIGTGVAGVFYFIYLHNKFGWDHEERGGGDHAPAMVH